MSKNNWGYPVFLIISLVIIFYLYKIGAPTNQLTSARQTIVTSTSIPTIEESPEPTQSPSPSTTPTPVTTTSSASQTSPSGPVSGQISCNYQIPATPNSQGTASIATNWKNLVLGKNGSSKTEVCLSTNAGSSYTLMLADTRDSGQRTDSAPWLSMGVSYMFSLFDTHGGDLPDCSGTALSSCQVNVGNIPPSPAPTRAGIGSQAH